MERKRVLERSRRNCGRFHQDRGVAAPSDRDISHGQVDGPASRSSAPCRALARAQAKPGG